MNDGMSSMEIEAVKNATRETAFSKFVNAKKKITK